MKQKQHDHALVYKAKLSITFLIGVAQFTMAVLTLFNRLSESANSEYILFNVLTNDAYWAGAFTISALLVFIGFSQYKLHPISMSVSSGLLLVWGLLIIGDVITTPINGLPIISGILAIALGVVSFFMSQIWNIILWDVKYNHHTISEAGAQVTWKG